jgi:RHS repeat-associated protein
MASFRYEYGPFGEALRVEGRAIAEKNPFRWATKYLDTESGLSYYGHRYYSADLGRWLSRDPIAESGGVNLYAMVGNDAVNQIDVLGLAACCPFGADKKGNCCNHCGLHKNGRCKVACTRKRKRGPPGSLPVVSGGGGNSGLCHRNGVGGGFGMADGYGMFACIGGRPPSNPTSDSLTLGCSRGGGDSSDGSNPWLDDFKSYWAGFGEALTPTSLWNGAKATAGSLIDLPGNLIELAAASVDIATSGYAIDSFRSNASESWNSWDGQINARAAGSTMGGVWAGAAVGAGLSKGFAANNALPQVLQNQAQGALGEAAVRARLLNSNRLDLVGEQIRITTPGVGSCRVTDFMVQSRQTGRLSIIEVKTGGATRDAIQLAKDALIADPLAPTTFTGRRAAAAGFPGGTPTGPIRTFEVNASNLNR